MLPPCLWTAGKQHSPLLHEVLPSFSPLSHPRVWGKARGPGAWFGEAFLHDTGGTPAPHPIHRRPHILMQPKSRRAEIGAVQDLGVPSCQRASGCTDTDRVLYWGVGRVRAAPRKLNQSLGARPSFLAADPLRYRTALTTAPARVVPHASYIRAFHEPACRRQREGPGFSMVRCDLLTRHTPPSPSPPALPSPHASLLSPTLRAECWRG